MAKKEIGFEESLAELKLILEKLGDPDMGVDESLKLYEKGIKLVRSCESQLDKVKQKIRYIDESNGGSDNNE